MDDSILCKFCGGPLIKHTGTRVDLECFQSACADYDEMTNRLRAFAEGLGLTGHTLEAVLQATPEECRRVGETVLGKLNVMRETDSREIRRLEGLIKTHQDSMRVTCGGVAKALGYQGPESGDRLEAFARKVREERDRLAGLSK